VREFRYLVAFGTQVCVVRARSITVARRAALEVLARRTGLLLGPEDLRVRRLRAREEAGLGLAGWDGRVHSLA
jgi:hypothetical protein